MRPPLALERVAIALTPVLALLTVAVGLRVGSSARFVGAKVYAPSPGGGREGASLRIVTIAEEGGVAETVSVPALTVVGSSNGQSKEWHGASNVEGVAEAWLDVRGLGADAKVQLDVKAGDGTGLANGSVTLHRRPLAPGRSPEVPATKRSGPLRIELYVYGGKLVPGASERVVARVRDAAGTPTDGVALHAEPEPGVVVDEPFSKTANGGWAEARVTAEYLLAPWSVGAKAAELEGSWYGALPIAAGGATTNLRERIDTAARSVELRVPPASRRLYAWVVDERGVDAAAALDVTPSSAFGVATLELPRLLPGTYWLYTSSSSHGAETNEASTVARPFVVADGPVDDARESPYAMTLLPAPAVRYDLVKDGLAAPRERALEARRKGVRIALAAILIAGVLETLLLYRAATRSRAKMRELADAAATAGLSPLGPAQASGVAALVLATLLGFLLLAALIVVRNGK